MTKTRTMIAALLAAAGSCAGQTIDWNAASGNWSNPANWNPQNVPDASGESATIAVGGVYTVNLNMSPTIEWVDISNPDATLQLPNITLTLLDAAGLTNHGTVYGYDHASMAGNITNYGLFSVRGYNQFLRLYGPMVINHGVFVVNPEHSGYYGDLRFASDTTLAGTGYVRLDWGPAYLSTGSGVTLTQEAGHAINGQGELRARLVNDGLVEADVAGAAMVLKNEPKINNASMRATGGAVLLADSVAIDQTGGGTMLAEDGSVVRLTDAAITGGVLDADGTGYIEHRGGNSTLTGVTNSGLFNLVGYNLYTSINGEGLHNDGSIVVNSDQSGYFASVRYTASGVLDGSGTMTLNNSTAWLESADGVTVTHGAAHTIEGGGRLAAALVNYGTVRANNPGVELLVESRAKTNQGEMLASDTATLRVLASELTQTGGGTIRAEHNSRVVLDDALLVGGTLDSVDTGYVEALDGNSTLRGVTNQGDLLLRGYNHYTYIDGEGLHNEGLIVVNHDQSGYFASLYYTQSGDLDGAGRLMLTCPTARIESADGVVVAHGPAHLIEGGGSVSAAMDNFGIVAATSPDYELVLDGRSKTNSQSLLALGGATLRVRAIEVSQSPGAVIRAGDGAQVVLENALIVGGMLDAWGEGYVEHRDGNSTLRSVTNEGALLLKGYNLYTFVDGDGLHNNGEIVVNHDHAGYFASLDFTEDGVLDGSGIVRLDHWNAYLESEPGIVVTQSPTHTIEGVGHLRAGLINNGLVEANDPAGELIVETYAKANNAVMRASGGGTLRIQSVEVDQTGGGVILAEDGTRAVLTEAYIIGGELGSAGTGYIEHRDGQSTLEGVTNLGLFNLYGYNHRTHIVNGLTNDGHIVVNWTNSGNYARIYCDTDVLIDGAGTITLAGPVYACEIQTAPDMVCTIGPGQTVEGTGILRGLFLNRGTLAPGLSAGSIETHGALAMTEESVLAVEIASNTTHDSIGGPADITLGGTLDLAHIDGYEPVLWDEFVIVSSNSVDGEFDAITGVTLPGAWVYKVRYEPTQAVLIITCPADTNADGQISTLDFLDFLNLWTAGDPRADWNDDGAVNTLDFLAYLNEWVAGCS